MSVTKAELAKLARHHLDIMGVAWLPDTSATRFSLYDALDWGLRDYYKAVECGPCTLGLTTVIDRGVYHHSAFGAVAEDLDAILPWELDAGPIVPANLLEPGLTIADRVLVTISVQNRTGIAANGNWEAYVVIGEGYGSVPLTETITFTSGAPGTDLFGVGDQAIVTHTRRPDSCA